MVLVANKQGNLYSTFIIILKQKQGLPSILKMPIQTIDKNLNKYNMQRSNYFQLMTHI